MALASFLVALFSIHSSFSASVAFDTIKFFLKLIVFMLLGVLLSQYRSSRRINNLLKKVEGLGRLQKQVDGLGMTYKSVVERLNKMQKTDALTVSQLEKMVYAPYTQDADLKKHVSVLNENVGRLMKSVGDLHMRLAVLSVDMQIAQHIADMGKHAKHITKNGANEADEQVAVSGGPRYEEVVNKQEYTPASTDCGDLDDETSRTRSIPPYGSEQGSDWETVAVRINGSS
ncbi:uncharacterized protein K460DRAFT_181791 [Cucurbitaria berberidis CBS 394.84]|uniref:Uncharacterized protein n=1 Tax=Cucurbitaria berberidis CBS 394.84 TaxID=1168544 RepID=A0A9P4GAY7_9PLEO|nr:uncharacterized protein K460DRAFT_181791 [Cucurbitaria berberidis CBS 394.84]KAF1842282.1 hypothetical protein K460DRAFT_181791 [Cucurbitaria berberidis CBS 394.84]